VLLKGSLSEWRFIKAYIEYWQVKIDCELILHFNFSSLKQRPSREPHSFAAGRLLLSSPQVKSLNQQKHHSYIAMNSSRDAEMHASKHSLGSWIARGDFFDWRPWVLQPRGARRMKYNNAITHVVGLHQIKRTASVGARHLISSQISAYKSVTAPTFLFFEWAAFGN
jgi:hypothetical protein